MTLLGRPEAAIFAPTEQMSFLTSLRDKIKGKPVNGTLNHA